MTYYYEYFLGIEEYHDPTLVLILVILVSIIFVLCLNTSKFIFIPTYIYIYICILVTIRVFYVNLYTIIHFYTCFLAKNIFMIECFLSNRKS